MAWLCCAGPLAADRLRIATWHADFSAKGPGLTLKSLVQAEPEIVAAVQTVAQAAPDVLVLTDFDFDHGGAALGALQALLAQVGHALPHRFARRPNTGMPTDRDLDGDGLLGGPRDAQGYGWFAGQGGQAVLSRMPLRLGADLSAVLWEDLPNSLMADDDPGRGLQRLSTSAHWDLRVANGAREIALLTIAATPPVFDGPEDRNGRRNADELALWRAYLDGALSQPPPGMPAILVGNLNLDPQRGDGRREAVQRLLADPRFTDPLPGQPTVTWDQTGPMRVSYILPAADLTVPASGIMPASPGVGPHRLLWVDVVWPPAPPAPAPVPPRLVER